MFSQRIFVQSLSEYYGKQVLLRGWVYRLRELAKTTFIILRDCSGEVQCVASSDLLKDLHLKLDDTIEIRGTVRLDNRSKYGHEVDILDAKVMNKLRITFHLIHRQILTL